MAPTFILLIQFLLFSGGNAFIAIQPGCDIDPFLPNASLPFRAMTNRIVYPPYKQKHIMVNKWETMEFACKGRKPISATCIGNGMFRVEGSIISWGQIISECQTPVSTIRKIGKVCGIDARLVEIGFDLYDKGFLRILEVCFNFKDKSAFWSHGEISSTIKVSSKDNTARSFTKGGEFFYDFPIAKVYTIEEHRATINGLLGLPNSSTKYISDRMFLAKGHLAARADFVYAAQRHATFMYINVAPQWQIFNSRNWFRAEQDTRNYAISHNISLQIWTGTYGIATLPHEKTGKYVDLYLYNHKALPVPALFWKVVYNPVYKTCIVLIGINNPYVANNIICENVSSKVKWVNWEKMFPQWGYMYACDLASFRKVVAFAPSLAVSGLLV